MKMGYFLVFILIFLGCNKSDPPEPIDDGSGQPLLNYKSMAIKDLVAEVFPDDKVYFGMASHHRLFGTATMDTVDAQFGYVTPANDFKQTYIHPVFGTWRWDKPDAWVQHARENGQIIRMHAPISPQCSKWVKEDTRTPEELDSMLTEYVAAICQRYNNTGEIVWLDVVNETIDKVTGGWFGPKPGTDKWENPWPLIGYDENDPLRPPLYIKKAFAIANEYGPNIRQIINQHGALEEATWEKMKELVAYLRKNGLRVDGVGWQAHIDLGWEKIPGNLARLDNLIKWCHANDLEFHITEFNVWLKGNNAGKLQEQVDTFTEIIRTVLDNRKTGTVAVNFWQVRSSETMHADWDGCLFDNDLNPKPAYFEVKKLIAGYK